MVDKISSTPAWDKIPRKVPQSFRRSMKICNQYVLANSVDEAVKTLAESQGSAKVVAGGTDLFLDIQQSRLLPPDTLVDVSEIPEMLLLEIKKDHLYIGGSVPHNRISKSSLVLNYAQALAEACGLIGGPQVRNVASLGGNVGHALPAADGTIALMAIDAHVEIANAERRRTAPLAELFRRPGENTLSRDEIIVGFYIPLQQENQASAFRRVMRPQGVAIAILNCAVWLDRNADEVRDIRISIGPSGPTPRRLKLAEDCFKGKTLSYSVIEEATNEVLNEAQFRTSRYRATQPYRRNVAGVLLRECVEIAWMRTGGEDIING